jgi:hypothetical protein
MAIGGKKKKLLSFRVLQKLSLSPSGTAPKTLAAVKVAAVFLFNSTRPEKGWNVTGAERGCLVRGNVIYAVDLIRAEGSRPFAFSLESPSVSHNSIAGPT